MESKNNKDKKDTIPKVFEGLVIYGSKQNDKKDNKKGDKAGKGSKKSSH
jgi:hypothetical protein